MLWPFGKGRSSAGVKETDRHGHGLLNLQRSSYLHPVSFIPGRANASPSNTQGGSPVRESRPLGSVRGVLSNGHSYRDSDQQLFISVVEVAERPQLAPQDFFRNGEVVATQHIKVLVTEG